MLGILFLLLFMRDGLCLCGLGIESLGGIGLGLGSGGFFRGLGRGLLTGRLFCVSSNICFDFCTTLQHGLKMIV